MPRILINENDKTGAGLAGKYSNYAVLITGFMGDINTAKGNVIQPKHTSGGNTRYEPGCGFG